MTEERSPWKGAAVGAGGGSLLAAALGYIYGHRGKWLAYDALTGGALGGAAGYGIEKFNKDRLDGVADDKDKTPDTDEKREAILKKDAEAQDASAAAARNYVPPDDRILPRAKHAFVSGYGGHSVPSQAWGNRIRRALKGGAMKFGFNEDTSQALSEASGPIAALADLGWIGKEMDKQQVGQAQARSSLEKAKQRALEIAAKQHSSATVKSFH